MSRQESKPEISGQQYVILPTSGHNHRCLLHAMGLSLVGHSQHGSISAQIHLNDPVRYRFLFEALARALPHLAETSTINENGRSRTSRQVTFTRLTHAGLSLGEIERVMGTALHEILVNQLQEDVLGQRVYSDALLAALLTDFDHFANRRYDQLSDCFYGMNFVTQQFQHVLTLAANTRVQVLRDWWSANNNSGYEQYVAALSRNAFLGGTVIGILCRHLGVNFSQLNSEGLLVQHTDEITPVTVIARHNGTNHWEAVVETETAKKLLRTDHLGRQGTLTEVGTTKISRKPDARSDQKHAEDYAKQFGCEGEQATTFIQLYMRQRVQVPAKNPEWYAYYAIAETCWNFLGVSSEQIADACQEEKKLGKSDEEAIAATLVKIYQAEEKKQSKEAQEETKKISKFDDSKLDPNDANISRKKRLIAKFNEEKENQTPLFFSSNHQQAFISIFCHQSKINGGVAKVDVYEVKKLTLKQKQSVRQLEKLWQKRIEKWKTESPAEMKLVVNKFEEEKNYKYEPTAPNAGRVIFQINPTEKVIVNFIIHRDNSLSLSADSNKHFSASMQKFAQLAFEQLKKNNGGVAVTEITLSNIEPWTKKAECIQAFKDAGFEKVHIKGDPTRIFKPKSCREESVSVDIVDKTPLLGH